jgi:tRNA(Ile)-lysidine synthase
VAEGFFPPAQQRGNQSIVRVGIERLREKGPLAQRYILRAALAAAGTPVREITHRRVERVRDLLFSGRRGLVLRLTETLSLMLDDTDLVLTRTHSTTLPEYIVPSEFQISRDGSWIADINRGPFARVMAEMMSMPEGGLDELLEDKPSEVEYLDAEKVLFPLFVRGRKDGDKLQTLGMDGEKKLQDILVDNKVPREERDVVPLVCDANGILVICGQGIAHRARVQPTTTQVMAITMVTRTGSSEASGFMPPVT